MQFFHFSSDSSEYFDFFSPCKQLFILFGPPLNNPDIVERSKREQFQKS